MGFLLAATIATCPARGALADDYSYGDIVEIAPDVRLIAGRALDMAAGEVDIANVLLYRTGSTLVVVDTGGTSGFIRFLDDAARQLEPYDEIVLITTHGHADHVGNNAWVDTVGVPARHFVSARDLVLMREQVPWFASRFDEANVYLPGSPPGDELARQIIDLFGGLDTETRSLTVLESLPFEEIRLGGTVWNGWSLLGGNVQVLRTGGTPQATSPCSCRSESFCI